MNKTDLINKLAERLEGDKKAAQSAVEGVIDLIVREVARGGSVSISGFGVFEKRARAARTARNPRTGEAVKVKKTTVPAFRPGKLFREVVAGTVKLPKVAGAPTSARATAAAARGGAAAKTAPAAAAPKPAVRTPRATAAKAAPAAAAPKPAVRTPRATAAKAAPAAAAPKPAVRTPRATAAKAAPAAAKTAAPKAAAVKATPKAAAPKAAAAKAAPKAAAPKAAAPKARCGQDAGPSRCDQGVTAARRDQRSGDRTVTVANARHPSIDGCRAFASRGSWRAPVPTGCVTRARTDGCTPGSVQARVGQDSGAGYRSAWMSSLPSNESSQ